MAEAAGASSSARCAAVSASRINLLLCASYVAALADAHTVSKWHCLTFLCVLRIAVGAASRSPRLHVDELHSVIEEHLVVILFLLVTFVFGVDAHRVLECRASCAMRYAATERATFATGQSGAMHPARRRSVSTSSETQNFNFGYGR